MQSITFNHPVHMLNGCTYAKGDIAGFPDNVCQRIVARGLAVLTPSASKGRRKGPINKVMTADNTESNYETKLA